MKSRKLGFTLIELMVVVAIIAILVTISVPVVRTAVENAKKAQARTEMKTIETAIRAYYNEYSKFPQYNGQADHVYASDNREIMNVLRSINSATGNSNYRNNPRRIVFMEVPANSIKTENFVDPWGVPYRIAVDTDFNNRLNTGVHGMLENTTVAVWSTGPGGLNSPIKDHLTTWK